jgi:leader peptidase (prepilin peptidase) / N-methyltransferase
MIDSFSAFWATPPADITATLCWSVIGLMIGSFLNVAIYRIPIMMQRESENYLALENDQPPPHTERYNLITPRSACTSCAHKLSLADNIPLLSFALLKARCRYCKVRISWRYPSVELLTAALSALVIWHLGSGIAGIGGLILLWMLIAMSFIDLDTQLLPDELTLPLMWLGLLINLDGTFVPLRDAVIGAAAGYVFLWLVYWMFLAATGKEGIGYGDFKLLAALGAWMGWMLLPLIVLLSSVVGATVGLLMIAFKRHHRDSPIPFGPFLATAGLLALLIGQPIINSWLASY